MSSPQHQEIKQKASLSVKKSQGITNKVLELIANDEYCPNIIQQIDAAIGLLNSSKKTLLRAHLDHCLEPKLKEDKQKTVNELIKIFDLK